MRSVSVTPGLCPTAVSFSGRTTGTLGVWSGKSGDDPVTTRKDTGPILDARPLPDGRFLFWSHTGTGTLGVWSGKSGDVPVTIRSKTGPIRRRLGVWPTIVSFSGRTLEPCTFKVGLIESRSSKTWHMPKGACVLLDIESGVG